MAKLKPAIIARAARNLFGTGHATSITFFFLKAQGASTDRWINITSSNEPPGGLIKIAGQPEGFDKLVVKYSDQFSDRGHLGYPTRPGARAASNESYSLYFPITEEAQYILRKNDANRNAIWSNITGGRAPPNSEIASRDEILELQEPVTSRTGKDIRFRQGYLFNAYWYYGPRDGIPMRIPLSSLAIWMHRTTELDPNTTIDELIKNTISILNITESELYLIFDNQYKFPLTSESFTDSWTLEVYFRALCIPSGEIMTQMPIVSEKWQQMNASKWNKISEILGFSGSEMDLDPEETARDLISSGECNLLFLGPPRTGKSHFALQLAKEYLDLPDVNALYLDPRFSRVQFHQGWSYGDFMRKITPVARDGLLSFERVKGVFLKHCQINSSIKSVFVIEEINRANIPNVLGEAFQIFEKGYRGTRIDLPGSLPEEKPETLMIPKELLLIATANDLDRTTLPLDFALLGRFACVTFPARYDRIYNELSKNSLWNSELAESFASMMNEIEGISGYPIGHASFYSYGAPQSVCNWYNAFLRPSLMLYLTQHRKEALDKIDSIIHDWSSRL